VRRRDEAIPFALVPRPKLSPHPPGREHGATGWGEKRQKTPRIFHRRHRRQIGVSGRSPDQSVLVARRRAVLQNTSGPVFEEAFQTGVFWSVTQWRFNKTYPVPRLGIGVRVSFVQKNTGGKNRRTAEVMTVSAKSRSRRRSQHVAAGYESRQARPGASGR